MPKKRPPLSNYGKLKRFEMPKGQGSRRIDNGSFSRIERINCDGSLQAQQWMYCREYFQNRSHGIRRMLFAHTQYRSYNIAAFIDKIESKLKLEQRTIVGPTQRNTVSWISINPWWTTTSMRRSFFTAMLRSGMKYIPSRNNFEEALFSNAYFRRTESAVRYFLDGHTTYKGRRCGWYTEFRYPSRDIKNILVRPK